MVLRETLLTLKGSVEVLNGIDLLRSHDGKNICL